jgi:hypothetical protein
MPGTNKVKPTEKQHNIHMRTFVIGPSPLDNINNKDTHILTDHIASQPQR